MAARRGSRSATSSSTRAQRAPINGTTAHSIPGSSSESGISNLHSLIRTLSMPEWKTRRCFAQRTPARRGKSFPACAVTNQDRGGQPGAGGWACTPSFSTRAIPTGSSSPSRPRACSARTTPARPGGRATAGCNQSTCPIPMRRSATASTASPCTRRVRTCCSCS